MVIIKASIRSSMPPCPGMKFPEYLTSKNILPGIKVDQGLEDFSPYEKLTKGLDGLSKRLE